MPGCAVLQLFINRHLLDGHILHINKFRLLYKADTQAHKPLSTHFHKNKLTFSPSLSFTHFIHSNLSHPHYFQIHNDTMHTCMHFTWTLFYKHTHAGKHTNFSQTCTHTFIHTHTFQAHTHTHRPTQ